MGIDRLSLLELGAQLGNGVIRAAYGRWPDANDGLLLISMVWNERTMRGPGCNPGNCRSL